MAKIAIITDSHAGIRNDNKNFVEYSKKFYDNIFFPYIDQNEIKHVIHLGDLVDRRKYIQYMTAATALDEAFMQPIFDRGLEFHIICGNHDTQFKHTNEFNAIKTLYGKSKYDLNIYENPATIEIDGFSICLIPWICQSNQKLFEEEIKNTKAQYLMGHLELNGFEMDKGHLSDHGLDKSLFSKFDSVYSGHFHHKSVVGNISYLGSPFQFTWADYDDEKGFHVLDTSTRQLTFVRNPYEIFKKYFYNDTSRDENEMLAFDPKIYEGTYVKVVVKNKTRNDIFEKVISKIEKAGAFDVQIIEDHLNLDGISDVDLVDEAQDTMSILIKSVSQIETTIEKKKIEKFIRSLYEEALTIDG